jgi:hypothetical protein
VSVKQVTESLPADGWKSVSWRQGRGANKKLRSRFAAVRVRPAHVAITGEQYPEEWLLIEWPKGEPSPPSTGSPPASRHLTDRVGAHGQASLDHRAGLSGTQAGTGPGDLKGADGEGSTTMPLLCLAAYGFLEPSFPLGGCRPYPTTNPRNPTGLPAPRLASVPSDINRCRS